MNVIGVTCSCLPKSLSQKAVQSFLRGAEEGKGPFYFTLMGVLAGLCVLGIFTFTKCPSKTRHKNLCLSLPISYADETAQKP